MAPSLFKEARETKAPKTIYGEPYNPNINVDTNTIPASILSTALTLLSQNTEGESTPEEKKEITVTVDDVNDQNLHSQLEVKVITGGITNALYRISGFKSLLSPSSSSLAIHCKEDAILVRIFGAEGMIDRDVETSTFACLSNEGIAPKYLGRFGNGRLEGWLEGFSPLEVKDLQEEHVGEAIAKQMAQLHFGFDVPEELKEWHNGEKPGMWSQLFSWLQQAKDIVNYKTKEDDERAEKLLDLPKVSTELDWLHKDVIPQDAKVAFCHNDLLAGNIMKNDSTGEIQLIDFEYGGVNYAAFDIANHFNEYAGGTDIPSGEPNYTLFPTGERQLSFIAAYVQAARAAATKGGDSDATVSEEEEIASLLKEVQGFVLANHMYWGLWAVNQAATEGTAEFDYLNYAVKRFEQYFEIKSQLF